MSRGGARQGAGRKAVDDKRVQMVITISAGSRDAIKDAARAAGVPPGKYIERLLLAEKK